MRNTGRALEDDLAQNKQSIDVGSCHHCRDCRQKLEKRGCRENKAGPPPLKSNEELKTEGWKEKEVMSHQLTQQC